MINKQYIAIEGVIGIGKTTLAQILAKKLKGKAVLEQFEHNEFLPKFYKQPKRYALALEISFLIDRYNQLTEHFQQSERHNETTIADYFFPKTLIFAQNNLTISEYSIFCKLFKILEKGMSTPDLIIYLYSDVNKIKKQIEERGRPYEKGIKTRYLKDIHDQYRRYFDIQKISGIVSIDVSKYDFVKNPSDCESIMNLLNQGYCGHSHGSAR